MIRVGAGARAAEGVPLFGEFALMTLRCAGTAVPALYVAGEVIDLTAASAAAGIGLVPDVPRFGLLDLLSDWARCFDQLRELTDRILSSGPDRDRFPVLGSDPAVLPPILRPGKMIYAAQNYPDHVQEMRAARKFGFNDSRTEAGRDFTGERAGTWPYVFLKAPSCLAGAYDDIPIPPEVTKLDWEVELAVAIGRRAKRVSADSAMTYVAGYMTTNDLSARNLLFRPDRDRLRSDWFSGKSHDGFAPMGPVLVPAAFVPDPLDLRLRLSVNGQLKQDGNTGCLIFSPAEQIEFASRMTTLEPGDVLATGTPGGVGQGTDNFLSAGDVVEAEVEGLGMLRNRVV
jgi:2,4-didehydro-3-deoxy-L-rhamnonate hydrolase